MKLSKECFFLKKIQFLFYQFPREYYYARLIHGFSVFYVSQYSESTYSFVEALFDEWNTKVMKRNNEKVMTTETEMETETEKKMTKEQQTGRAIASLRLA